MRVATILALSGLSLALATPTTMAQQSALVWAKQLTSNCGGGPSPEGVAVDAAGSVYIAGSFCGSADFDPGPVSQPRAAASTDTYVLKLDSAGNFVWMAQFGGAGFPNPMPVQAVDLAVDLAGNIVVTGSFQSTADFDPGPGTFGLTSAGSSDVFVVKLDTSGGMVWARRVGGTGTEASDGIAVDSAGNVYTVGGFTGTADFDPGPDTLPLNSAGQDDAFIVKLDAAGNLAWAARVGGTGADGARAVAVDGQVPIFVGLFSGTADFDPGSGTHNFTASGLFDAFVCKLTVSGQFDWARQLGGSSASDNANDVAVGALGEIVTVGQFGSTVDFDPSPGTFNLTAAATAAFVWKLNNGGNFLFAKQFGGAAVPGPVARSVDFVGGHVYTVGTFRDSVDFDPGPANVSLASAGEDDAFVSKLTDAGSFVSAIQLGGTNFDRAFAVAATPSGNIHTVGTFRGPADFDPSSLEYTLPFVGFEDMFVSRHSPSLMGGSVSGLTLSKSGATGVRLDWNASCTPSMSLYGVYRGTLGDFDSHFVQACFITETSLTFTPDPGNLYFLVVPNNDFDEGSYGRNSAGIERPQGIGVCASRVILLGCP